MRKDACTVAPAKRLQEELSSRAPPLQKLLCSVIVMCDVLGVENWEFLVHYTSIIFCQT